MGRPLSEPRARASRRCAVELAQTACYTCTGWHTCLVFVTDDGVRLPLCESCLPFIVERAAAAQALA